jgi:hypothetical protein
MDLCNKTEETRKKEGTIKKRSSVGCETGMKNRCGRGIKTRIVGTSYPIPDDRSFLSNGRTVTFPKLNSSTVTIGGIKWLFPYRALTILR